MNDEVIRKIPTEGQALLTLFGEFSDITFSSEESSRSINLPGQCLMMNPRHAKSKGRANGLCYCVVLYFQGVISPVVPNVNRNSNGGSAMGAPTSTPIMATSQVRRERNIVQACCEPGNHIHRKTEYSAGCISVNITVEDDFTLSTGIQTGLDGLRS